LYKNIFFHFLLLFVISLLITLGFWQLQRLEWKNTLLSKIEDNYNNITIDFPFLESSSQFEYMKSNIDGNYLSEKLMFFYRSNLNGDSGFNVVIPFKTTEGIIVYVDNGWIPFKNKENLDIDFINKSKVYSLSGALIFKKDRKYFTPENDYNENIWYLLNTDEMDSVLDLSSSNYILKLIDQNYFEEFLIEFNPTNIKNNHLQYAVTWFLMALFISIFYIYLIKQQVRKR
tara:strand:- start:3818 stop:4507 length:690 start_codon:yes stop_codon:yes gene_type:complete